MLVSACAYPDAAAIDERDIRAETSTYLKDLASDDGADAYALLSPAIRARCGEASFRSDLDSISAQIRPQEAAAKLEDVEIAGNSATAKLVLDEADPDGPLMYQYVKEGPRWYLLPPNFTC